VKGNEYLRTPDTYFDEEATAAISIVSRTANSIRLLKKRLLLAHASYTEAWALAVTAFLRGLLPAPGDCCDPNSTHVSVSSSLAFAVHQYY
jgi:hypothetical protein